jgi:regulator of replication initiation timing
MSDLVTLVSGIEFKIRELTDKKDHLEKEYQILLEENKALKSKIEEDKLNIKQLEYRNQIIKFAKVLEGNKGSTKAKQELNELLREVDRCIGLLND